MSYTTPLEAELAQLSPKELRERAVAAGIDHHQIENARDADAPKPALIALILANSGLESELARLSLKELRARAEADGVDKDQIEEARDGDQPKEDIIKLLIAKHAGGGTAALEAELAQLSLKELRTRAEADGVDKDQIEEARDGEQPKEDIIKLLIAKHAGGGTAAALEAELAQLETELVQLSLKELRTRAEADGVDDDRIEEARDGEQPKGDIVNLIVAQRRQGSMSVPGSVPPPRRAGPPAHQVIPVVEAQHVAKGPPEDESEEEELDPAKIPGWVWRLWLATTLHCGAMVCFGVFIIDADSSGRRRLDVLDEVDHEQNITALELLKMDPLSEHPELSNAVPLDSCIWAHDGQCDHHRNCEPGTDTSDCKSKSSPAAPKAAAQPARPGRGRRLQSYYSSYSSYSSYSGYSGYSSYSGYSGGYGYGYSGYSSYSGYSGGYGYGSAGAPIATILLGCGPAVHVILLPIFMFLKRRHGKDQIQRMSRGSGNVETQLDDDGQNMIFSIKYTLGQKIFILLIGKLIDLGTFLVRLWEIVGLDLSNFWFPMPFWEFFKAKCQVKNYRIKGAKVRLNASQADAYFRFLSGSLWDFCE
jgi:hypothetical protein